MAHSSPSPSPLITILGSLNMDLVSYVPHHPLPGETLTSTSFTTSPGGKGANQAVACAKLSRTRPTTGGPASSSTSTSTSAPATPSAQISMLGAVGSDSHGQTLLSSLQSHGVNTKGIRIQPDLSTGLALIIVDQPTGQNRIILSPGANHSLTPHDFSTSVHDGGGGGGAAPSEKPDLLIMQLEIPLQTVLQALRTAKMHGIPVLLNPAPAQVLPPHAYAGLAHLIVNETEAAILSEGFEQAQDENLHLDLESPQGLQSVAEAFLARGVQNLVITLGARGVFYATCSGESALVEAIETDVVDTTAAGDTFVGSYALAVVRASKEGETFDIDAAVRAANRASSITVSRKGAQISIPWKDELE
ncbi:hypothetical protein E4U21_004579 [Claviceps maximensis]|nr:hypothetical protein E4U21_004579 [Claviceps maximensis]